MSLIRKILFCYIVCASTLVYSTEETYSNRIYPSTGATNLAIEDGRFEELIQQHNFVDFSKELRLKLGIDFKASTPYISAFEYSVDLIITPYNIYGNSEPIINRTLSISYSPVEGLQNYINTAIFLHEGFYKYNIAIDINSINCPAEQIIYLESELVIDRFYEIASSPPNLGANLISYSLDGSENKTVFGQPAGSVIPTNNSLGRELEIWWDYIEGAEDYELEWTWIDNYSETSLSATRPASSISLTNNEFERNNTRVITNKQTYRIPVVYDRGFIVYRVRGVGRWLDDPSDETKSYKFGPWSKVGTTTSMISNWTHYVRIDESHQKNKNWQYQSVFAEEGKKKEIVSYFDGSLRNRQTVTKINSNNEAIVGESVYDNQGRAAVQILPVPVGLPALNYYPQLNRGIAYDQASNELPVTQLKPFSHYDFDWDYPTNLNSCDINSVPMSATTGASKYYSVAASGVLPENNWQDNVPSANGYPYTQIEYTPDNTGRIKTQSGVGSNYKIGEGHETKYFYARPKQLELNRLFGYQVGNILRYKKNTVVDANGQVSVSYLDPQGRVIATALSGDNNEDANGDSDTHLASLDSENGSAPPNGASHGQITTDLLGKNLSTDQDMSTDANELFISGLNGASIDGLKLKTIENVATESPYTFDYEVKTTFFAPCATDNTETYPFDFLLDIDIRDDCGEPVIPANYIENNAIVGPDGQLTENIDIENFDDGFDWTIPTMAKGNYDIVKKLVVNPVKLHEYALDYVKNSSCITSLTPLTTANCYDGNGPPPPPDPSAPSPVPGVINTGLTSCSTAKYQMLQDLSPGGQYGNTNGTDLLSVFSGFNYLKRGFKSVMFDDNHINLPAENPNRFCPINNADYGVTNGTNPFVNGFGSVISSVYVNDDGTAAEIEVVWDDINDEFSPQLIEKRRVR